MSRFLPAPRLGPTCCSWSDDSLSRDEADRQNILDVGVHAVTLISKNLKADIALLSNITGSAPFMPPNWRKTGTTELEEENSVSFVKSFTSRPRNPLPAMALDLTARLSAGIVQGYRDATEVIQRSGVESTCPPGDRVAWCGWPRSVRRNFRLTRGEIAGNR